MGIPYPTTWRGYKQQVTDTRDIVYGVIVPPELREAWAKLCKLVDKTGDGYWNMMELGISVAAPHFGETRVQYPKPDWAGYAKTLEAAGYFPDGRLMILAAWKAYHEGYRDWFDLYENLTIIRTAGMAQVSKGAVIPFPGSKTNTYSEAILADGTHTSGYTAYLHQGYIIKKTIEELRAILEYSWGKGLKTEESDCHWERMKSGGSKKVCKTIKTWRETWSKVIEPPAEATGGVIWPDLVDQDELDLGQAVLGALFNYALGTSGLIDPQPVSNGESWKRHWRSAVAKDEAYHEQQRQMAWGIGAMLGATAGGAAFSLAQAIAASTQTLSTSQLEALSHITLRVTAWPPERAQERKQQRLDILLRRRSIFDIPAPALLVEEVALPAEEVAPPAEEVAPPTEKVVESPAITAAGIVSLSGVMIIGIIALVGIILWAIIGGRS